MLFIAIGIVFFTVFAVFGLEKLEGNWVKTLLNWFPAILFAYVIPACITHLFKIDLSRVEMHNWSKEWVIPMAILLVMSSLSFNQLKIIGIRPILLFVFGSFVIATFAPLLVLISKGFSSTISDLVIEEEYWKGLVPIVGSWIGGSTSQLVLKEVIECPEGLFLSILVLDNVLVNIWTILMFQMIQRSDYLNKIAKIEDEIRDFVPDVIDIKNKAKYSILMTVVGCILVIVICSFMIDSFLWKIIILSLIGLSLGNFIPNWNHAFVLKAGGVFIVLIMSILGLKLNFNSLDFPGILIAFTVIWLLIHFVLMIVCAKMLNLHMAWVPIASMANLGGISTAPAVTAAYNEEWMPHAIVLAILSMVSGTSWGLLTIFLFKMMG